MLKRDIEVAGESLVEVLVALLVLTLGLLTMAALQARAQALATEARQLATASLLMTDLTERLEGDGRRAPQALRAEAIEDWRHQVGRRLPSGQVRLAPAQGPEGLLDVWIAWRTAGVALPTQASCVDAFAMAGAAGVTDAEDAEDAAGAGFRCLHARVMP